MGAAHAQSFGDLLKQHRLAAGLSQEDLAARAGLSPRGISDLERGARKLPRPSTLTLLADALGLTAEQRAIFFAAAHPSLGEARWTPEAGAGREVPASPAAPPGVRHNLTASPTPLLGREREVADVCALMHREDVRLVTLTGPGGVGKTRLGLRVAAELANAPVEADGPSDGVRYVRLARLSDPDLVLPTIAHTLGLREAGGRPIADVLREHLRPRRLLLLLDNFEHLLAAAPGVAALLAESPGLRVLATSRERLHLSGEVEYTVPPLVLPDLVTPATPERISQYAAVRLFIQRAAAVQADFQVTAANAPVVAGICARLDGLPLAIELGAARVKLLPPPALLQRLERQLPLLSGGARDLDERQRTMRGTLAWSYDLLDPEEQRLFRRLAVFVGGCTLEAAEAVCAAPVGADPLNLDVLAGLSALVDKSLVQQREEGGGPRFGLLHVIREYALDRLEASGEVEALRTAHAAYHVDFAERGWAAVVAAKDADEDAAHIERMEAEQDNLRAALAWLRARAEEAAPTSAAWHASVARAAQRQGVEAPALQGLRLAAALLWPWSFRGHLGEGRMWLEAFLALDAPSRADAGDQAMLGGDGPPVPRRGGRTAAMRPDGEAFVRARALYAAGVLAYWQGDSAKAVPSLQRSLAMFQALGDRRSAGFALNNLGRALQDQGDLGRARACYEQSLALGRALGERDLLGMPLSNLGAVTFATGDLDLAAALSEEALAISRQTRYDTGAGVSLVVQALIAWRRGHLGHAAALAEEALRMHHAAGDVRHFGDGLEVRAIMLATRGHAERAARVLGAAAASRERIGMRRQMEVPTSDDIEAAVAPARAALGEERWAAAFAAGGALTLDEAIAEALGEEVAVGGQSEG